MVDTAPIDGGFGGLVADHELVARRAAGLIAGADHQAAATGEQPFAALDGFFDELRRAQIPEHETRVADAVLLETVMAGTNA